MNTSANDTQVGGSHYRGRSNDDRQHWDMCHLLNWDYFLCAATKYVDRLGKKNNLEEELRKAAHYLTKRLELVASGAIPPDTFFCTGGDERVKELIDWIQCGRRYSAHVAGQTSFWVLILHGHHEKARDLAVDMADVVAAIRESLQSKP